MYYHFILIHWFFIPAIVIVTSHFLFGSIKLLSFQCVYLFSFFVLIYIQALNIYINDIMQFEYILSVWSVPLLYIFVSGSLLAIFKHGPRKIKDSIDLSVLSKRDIFLSNLTPILSFLFVILFLFYIFDIGLSKIPLFYIFSNPGDTSEVMKLRIGALESNYGGFLTLIYSYSRSLLYPLYIAFLTALRVKKLIKKRHFLIVFATAILFAASTTAKAPIAYVCFSVLISYYFARNGKVPKAKFGGAILAFLCMPALIYPLLFGIRGFDAIFIAMEQLWRRLTWVPSYAAAVYFDAFTNHYPHMGFTSNRLLAFITGNEYMPTAAFIYDNYFQTSIPGGLVNASYFASFYADWGMNCMLLITFLISMYTVGTQIFFDRFGKDMTSVAFRSVTLISIVQLMQTNIYSTSLGRGFVLAPILFILLTLFWIILKGSTRKNLHVCR
jgi:oligosaccharide repeat unit polymerase